MADHTMAPNSLTIKIQEFLCSLSCSTTTPLSDSIRMPKRNQKQCIHQLAKESKHTCVYVHVCGKITCAKAHVILRHTHMYVCACLDERVNTVQWCPPVRLY